MLSASLIKNKASDKSSFKEHWKTNSANMNPGQHMYTQIQSHLRPADEGHLYPRAVTGVTMWANDFHRCETWSATVFIGH